MAPVGPERGDPTSAQGLITTSKSGRRPKLSLHTANVPIAVGKSSTALAFTASAVDTGTPTLMNTLSNAYSIPHRPSPQSATPRPGKVEQASTPPLQSELRHDSSSPSSAEAQPYLIKLPLGVRPILRNSLIKHNHSASSASPRSANARRMFFPAAKKVKFRPTGELEEVVKTTQYAMAHADLSSSEDERPFTSNSPNTDTTSPYEDDTNMEDEGNHRTGTKHPIHRLRPGRMQVRVEMADTRPAGRGNVTPGRSAQTRKIRRWEWTLGPVEVSGATATELAISTKLSEESVDTRDQCSITARAPVSPKRPCECDCDSTLDAWENECRPPTSPKRVRREATPFSDARKMTSPSPSLSPTSVPLALSLPSGLLVAEPDH